MKKLIFLIVLIPNILNAGSMKMIGMQGNKESVDRTINVSMYDNYYQPNKFKIKKGETIKFIVQNKITFTYIQVLIFDQSSSMEVDRDFPLSINTCAFHVVRCFCLPFDQSIDPDWG